MYITSLDFDSPANRQKSLADLKSLLDHPGWLLLRQIVEANIDYLKTEIIAGGSNETVESINRLRDKVKVNSDVIGTPERMIKKLTPIDPSTQVQDDPYL